MPDKQKRMIIEDALPWLREHQAELLESTRRYLEGKLKLKMNVEKSKVVSVFSIRNFKFLGFAIGKGKDGVYIRVHVKSMKKAKAKLKELTRDGMNG